MVVRCVPRGLLNQYIAGFAACLSVLVAGATYGWVTPIITKLTGKESAVPMTITEEGWVISVIELGNLLSPLPAGMLANYLGRKPVILASGPLFMLSWLLVLYFRTALWLAVARVLQGFAMGLTFTATPVYLGEIAGSSSRGAITSMFFTFWWIGFLIEFAIGPYLSFDSFTWLTCAMNVPFLLLFLVQPETPYFHVLNGKPEKALEVLRYFRDPATDQIEEEMEQIEENVKASDLKSDFRDIVATATDRKAFNLLMAVTAVRILSGTGSLLVYATQIFELTSEHIIIPPNVVTLTLGLVMFVGGCIGSFTSDSLGRRPLLLISCIGSFICQFTAGAFYFLLFKTDIPVARFSWVAPVMILTYSALCSIGLYPVCSSYTSELFTTSMRGYASCLSSINVTVFSFIMLATYSRVTDSFGVYTNFFIYSGITFFGSIYFYYSAPETKDKSFSQIRRELCESTK